MAVIVEDGTVVANANAYASVAEADTYLASRNRRAWLEADDGLKESAILVATDYIELRYGHSFIGCKQNDGQSLSWPRKDCGYDNVIPPQLKRACMEYASIVFETDWNLLPNPKFDDSGLGQIERRRKVGPIEKEFRSPTSGKGSKMEIFRVYPVADELLKGLLKKQYGGVIRN